MWFSENWKDYELLDTSDGERLERWGNLILIWMGLMILGVIVSLPYGKIFKKNPPVQTADAE